MKAKYFKIFIGVISLSSSGVLDHTETITVKEVHRIKIKFKDFNIQHHASCESDYLKIIDGDGTPLLNKVCGSELPNITLSRTEMVHIIFHSDGAGNKILSSNMFLQWQMNKTMKKKAKKPMKSPLQRTA